jgi:NADH:ubiquinone oxidoreductase subunit 5 (subunit L)/multisubunit Na+/H+ antiporter MnhA subunit
MFFKFWIIWALIGLAGATCVFSWALRTRQFEEGRRAALLPLDDVPLEPPSHSKTGRFHFWVIMAILAVGVVMMGLATHLALTTEAAVRAQTEETHGD